MKIKIQTIILVIILHITSAGYSQDFWEGFSYPDTANAYTMALNSQGTIFISVSYPSGMGIIRSYDDGLHWEKLSGLPNEAFGCIYIDDADNIYAGSSKVYFSGDNGLTWSLIFTGTGFGITSIHKNSNDDIFIGLWGGIFKSVDNGNFWTQVLFLPNNEVINSIIEENPGKLYAGTINFISGGGVYQSLNWGDTWELTGLIDHYVSSLGINSLGDLFAGTRGHNILNTGGVFELPSGQTEWNNVNDEELVISLAINSKGIIFIGCYYEFGYYGGVRCSSDNGLTWQPINSGMGNQSVETLLLGTGEHIYAFAHVANSRSLIFRSVNSTVPAFILDGRVTYPNANCSSLSNIELALMQGDSLIRSAITSDAGHYSFDSLDNGMYTLVPSTSKPWGGVTAMDVLLYQKHIAGISPLSGIYLASGDVNGSGTITAVDMLLIKKRIAGMTDSFPAGDWFFNNEPVIINESSFTYNFNGICFGDANGSYVPPEK
jgi:hypothetical protein